MPYEALAALAERGLWGGAGPTAYGGLGLRPAQLFDVCAAIGAGCGVTALLYAQHLTAHALPGALGRPGAADLLRAVARGEAILGVASGQATRRPGGPARARARGRPRADERPVPWFSGAGLMTHALLAADDPVADPADGLAMAVVPFAPPAVRFSPPGRSDRARRQPDRLRNSFTDLDVTPGSCRRRRRGPPCARPWRASRRPCAASIRVPAAALDICAATPYAPPEALAVVDWLGARLEAICGGLRGALDAEGADPR